MSRSAAPRSRARTFTHWLAGILVAALAVGGFSAPAFAAGGQVTVFPVEPGVVHDGTPVLVEGTTYDFQLGYGSMDDGAVVDIVLPGGITIPDDVLKVPAGNTAVESLTSSNGRLIVTFKDPFPADVNQGILDLKFTLDDAGVPEARDIVWGVNGVPTSQKVIVTVPGELPQKSGTSSSKTAAKVTLAHSVVGGKVTFADSILDAEIPYTVTVSSAQAREVTIADTLGAHLSLVEGSLTGSKTVRDATGMNPISGPATGLPNISGTSFTHAFSAEANSLYTFTYRAKIADAAALEEIRVELQAAYDAVDEIDGGNYSVTLSNSAVIQGDVHIAGTQISGSVKGAERPGYNAAFSKQVTPSAVSLDDAHDAGASLDAGIPVSYTLRAALTEFAAFAGGPFGLDRNLLVTDTLPAQAIWSADDAGFLTATDENGDAVTLTKAEGLTGNVATGILADEYVHSYVVVGGTLYINLGKDTGKEYTIRAAAAITVLPAKANSETPYDTKYRVDNSVRFTLSGKSGDWITKTAGTTITVPKDTSAGVDDPQRFDKSAPGGLLQVTSGTSVTIPYTFTIGKDVGNAASSRIIDVVDHAVFDVTEDTLPAIKNSITGTYDSNFPLDGDTFDVSLDADKNLVIAPSAGFPKESSSGVSASEPLTGTWTITVGLPTHVLQGKQTLDISNTARYEGDDQEFVYVSGSSAKATSFGNEMEVRKRVYDAANDAFTGSLRVETDADGKLSQSEFVYRVELIPHGTFSNMVEDVVDVLPAGIEFLGFIAPGDVTSGNTTGGASYAVPGTNITAVYDSANNTVSLQRGKLVSGKTLELFFKVELTDAKANIGVMNVIGAASATITPTNDYPLSLFKRDSTDATILISDPTARFSVLAADQQTVVLGDLRVVDGRILTATGETPTVKTVGEYWLREDVAPVGYLKTNDLSPIIVEPNGASEDVLLYNAPGTAVLPAVTYAIGDVTWIDADKDGKQGADEKVLPGVTVELIQNGEVIATDVTDEYGRYLFDELPAGEYQVKFTLTAEQQKIYTFTQADAGTEDAEDSDADPETGLTQTIVLGEDNIRLTHDYQWANVLATQGIDPTWDAGVIVRESVEPGEPTDPEDPTVPTVPGEPTVPADPTDPGTPGVNELPRTGGALPLGIAGGALALLLAGASLFFWRRRTV